MDDFTAANIQTGEVSIFVRSHGSGPPILLLHGFPQTHLMRRSVAPPLARDFTVVCADLRGYGRSSCPVSTPDHSPYAKRAMAQDLVTVMERLGFPRFVVARHDCGGRVAYRMALDHPARIERIAVPDVVPKETAAIFTDILGLVARVLASPRRASGMHWTASLIPETLRRWEGIGPRRNRGRHGAYPCATPCRKPANGRRYAALRDGHAVQDADRFPFMRARRAAAARDASSAGTAAPVPK